MKTTLLRFSVFLTLLLAAWPLQAQNLDAVKQRMNDRLPALDALRSSGAIGENNRGLTEVREAKGEAASISAAENTDRSAVYAAIASQTGTTAEAVGRARARQIAANSAAGVWLQRDDGHWYKK